MSEEKALATRRGEFDFDLHGLAGVRLLDASPDDAATVSRQLGPIAATLDREPDIVVRFVDRLDPGRLHLLGVDDAGFTDEAFLVLRAKHKTRARVRIGFHEIGDRPEIVCERGLPAVPLLIPILNLTVLANGALPLHAAAFSFAGRGVVATGWSKGGKTETLLAFAARGAEYVGDEWVYLDADGERVYGIPEPIRVWDWHLRQLPQYREAIRGGDRRRLRALRSFRSLERFVPDGTLGDAFPAVALRRIFPVLESQLFVDVDPRRLFGTGFGPLAAPFDHLFFVGSHEAPEIVVRPVDSDEVARRMVFSLQHERMPLMAYYLKFRFAFPELANPLLEQAESLQRERLCQLLAGKPTYAVEHPYPVSIPALFDAISPYCR
ncbi:MAG TPA: hypothetical protein VFK76_03010 [Gaiellaceae bacterium]|nr:hypothetical protein [Gaiellaceae bacterium]